MPCFDRAVRELRKRNIDVIVHTILGLPGEGEKEVLETIHYLNECDIQGIKLQLLHFLRGTDLGELYVKEGWQALTMEEYIQLVIRCLEELNPEITVHRLTGDGPKDLLIAPLWSSGKRTVLNQIHKEMKERAAWQGRRR